MSKLHLEQLLQTALKSLQQNNSLLAEIPSIQIDTTKDKQYGDFASNIALILAKQAKQKPRDLAVLIVAAIPPSVYVEKIEIAGPGFINFYLTPQALYSVVPEIIKGGDTYGQATIGQNRRVMVEFVSSNPTGPLHVGHGRHAAYGMVVADLLATVGFDVHREYYINDAGRQMDILAVSVWVRYLSLNNETLPFPANAYKGEYVIDIAKQLKDEKGDEFLFTAQEVFQDLPIDEAQGGDKEIYIDALILQAKKLAFN